MSIFPTKRVKFKVKFIEINEIILYKKSCLFSSSVKIDLVVVGAFSFGFKV